GRIAVGGESEALMEFAHHHLLVVHMSSYEPSLAAPHPAAQARRKFGELIRRDHPRISPFLSLWSRPRPAPAASPDHALDHQRRIVEHQATAHSAATAALSTSSPLLHSSH